MQRAWRNLAARFPDFKFLKWILLLSIFFAVAVYNILETLGRGIHYLAAYAGVVLALWCGMYGLMRIWRFHPILNKDYALWLKMTPWQWGKPLPGGSILPDGLDALFMGAVSLATYWLIPGFPWWAPAATAAVGYLIFAGLSPGLGPIRLGLLTLWGLLIYRIYHPAEVAVLALAIAVMTGLHLRLSLQRFMAAVNEPMTISIEPAGSAIRWLTGQRPGPPAPKAGRPGIGAISGAVAWALVSQYFDAHGYNFNAIYLLIMIALGFVALDYFFKMYCRFEDFRLCSPAGLGARWATRRWIVPRYDIIWFSPLLIVAGLLFCVVSLWSGEQGVVRDVPIGTGLVLLGWLVLRPNHQRWLLTGEYSVPDLLRSRPVNIVDRQLSRRLQLPNLSYGVVRRSLSQPWRAFWAAAVLGGVLCVLAVGMTLGFGKTSMPVITWTAVSLVWILLYHYYRYFTCGLIVRPDFQYLRWLLAQPWRRDRQLPLGSLAPAWADLAFTAVLMLVHLGGALLVAYFLIAHPQGYWRGLLDWWTWAEREAQWWAVFYCIWPLWIMMVGRGFVAGMACRNYGDWLAQPVLLAWLGVVALVAPDPIQITLVLLAGAAGSCWLTVRAMRNLPQTAEAIDRMELELNLRWAANVNKKQVFSDWLVTDIRVDIVGYWNTLLSGLPIRPAWNRARRLLAVTLAGWLVWATIAYCINYYLYFNPGPLEDWTLVVVLMLFLFILVVAGGTFRLEQYLKHHLPPHSFGRMVGDLAEIEWTWDGFATIFRTPLLAIVTFVLLGIVLPSQLLDWPWLAITGVIAGAVAAGWVLVLGGPSLEEWRLCGKHCLRKQPPAEDPFANDEESLKQ